MNKINQYVSTYQRDYTWPHVTSVCRTEPPIKPIVKDCTCTDSRQERKELLNGELEKYVDWSRTGPMGRLLEPKIYEAKIERTDPKTDIIRLDRLTNICFKEARPGLYETLEKSFPKEPITRKDSDLDVMKTTYQKDYSEPAAARMAQKDMPLTVLDTDGECLPCMPTKIIIKTDCPPCCRLSSSIYNEKRNHKPKIGLKQEKKCNDIKRRQIALTPWKSEYQDSINKIGQAIMKVKLHHVKKRTLPIQYQYNTPSRTC